MKLRVLADAEAVAGAAAAVVAEAQAAAGERFAICLAGGATPLALYRLLAGRPLEWWRWHVFYGDERRVPLDDPRSNHGAACAALLDRVPIPPGQVYPLVDADQYEGLLRAFFGQAPDFDLLLLGMGDDGHTASLFPGSIALHEEQRWVIAAPEVVAGMSRLTLTLPALNAARRTLFLVSGESKRAALDRVRAGQPLPAALVRDAEWLVDAAAAG